MPNLRKSFDESQIVSLASVGCTVEDIARVVGCNKKTLERRFKTVIEKGRMLRNVSLRRKQFDLAMKGNVTMLIWLGKQYLGQKDKHEVTGSEDGPLVPPGITIEFVNAANVRAERALAEQKKLAVHGSDEEGLENGKTS